MCCPVLSALLRKPYISLCTLASKKRFVEWKFGLCLSLDIAPVVMSRFLIFRSEAFAPLLGDIILELTY